MPEIIVATQHGHGDNLLYRPAVAKPTRGKRAEMPRATKKQQTLSNAKKTQTSTPQTGKSNVDWSVYLQKGVIAELQIKRYRGTTSIDFSELGINEDSSEEFRKFMSSYMTPGQKRLIPPEIEGQLKSIETTARQNLKECSFPCTAFDAQGKFIPASSYRKFKSTNEELKDRFFTIRDEFASNYDNIVAKVKKDYRVLAENIYMQAHPDAKRPSARFVSQFVDGIISQIPPKDTIVATFEYNTILRPIPQYLLNVIRKKKDIDERVMSIAASNMFDGVEGVNDTPAPDVAEHDEYIIPQQTDDVDLSEDDDAIDIEDIVDDDQQQQFDATDIRSVRKAKAAGVPVDRFVNSQTATRKRERQSTEAVSLSEEIANDVQKSLNDQSKAMATGFIIDIMTKLRTMAFEGATTIIQSIDKNNGKLVGRASMKAHSLIDDLHRMDYGDDVLRQMVDKLEMSLVSTEDKARDISAVRTAAVEMRDWAMQSLQEIAQMHYAGAPQPPVKERKPSDETPQRGRKRRKSDDTKINVPTVSKTRRTIKHRVV